MQIIHLKDSSLRWTRSQIGLLDKTESKISEILKDFFKSTPGGGALLGRYRQPVTSNRYPCLTPVTERI